MTVKKYQISNQVKCLKNMGIAMSIALSSAFFLNALFLLILPIGVTNGVTVWHI